MHQKTITRTQKIHNPHPATSREEPIPNKLVRGGNVAKGDLLDAENPKQFRHKWVLACHKVPRNHKHQRPPRILHVKALNALSDKQEKRAVLSTQKIPTRPHEAVSNRPLLTECPGLRIHVNGRETASAKQK
jgi:hypothetical protein